MISTFTKMRIFSSGNELREPNQITAPQLGTVYDSNRPGLIAYLQTLNCHVVDLGIIKDEESLIKVWRQVHQFLDSEPSLQRSAQ